MDSRKYKRLLRIAIDEVFQDANAPIINWDQKGKRERLGIVHGNKGELVFKEYYFNKGIQAVRTSQVLLQNIDAVNQLSFTPGKEVYFSANKDGVRDVFLLKGSRLKQMTYSKNEEKALLFGESNNKQGLFFIAAYPGDTMYAELASNKASNESKLYFLNTEQLEILSQKSRPYVLPTVVKSWNANETDIRLRGNQSDFYYQSLSHGFAEIKAISNGKEQIINRNSQSMAAFKASSNKVNSYIVKRDSVFITEYTPQKMSLVKSKLVLDLEQLERIKAQKAKKKDNKKPESLNLFRASKKEVQAYKDSLEKARYFQKKRSNPYKLKLVSGYTSASLNNTLLINRYQSYQFNQGMFNQANIGGLVQYAFTDIFENYKVSAGVRLPANGKGSDFFAAYENRKGLLDWGANYLRHVEKFTLPNNSNWFAQGGVYFPPYIKQRTNYIEGFARFPFRKSQAVKMSLGLRHDRQVFIASDTFSLFYPDTTQLWSLGRLEYQLDKSKKVLEDIRQGFRAKVFFEYHAQLAHAQSSFMHFGLDARYYQPIYKNIIWANRLQAASSGGETAGIMYTLGGTQNQIAPLVDSQASFLPTENYSLIAYATGLRGYAQNVRFGNTYVLINSEVRIPVLNTFFNIQTRLNSLNNLKLVLFTDVANAWNREKLRWSQVPQWAHSYGVGVHTSLLNYQIRMDVAWQNLEQNQIKKPLFIFSLGQNF